jgi:O-antigen/teichoic acid export membrane protein
MIEPELGLAFGKGDQVLFRQIIRRSCQVALWSTFLFGFILWFAGERLLELWTHGRIVMEWSLFTLLVFAAVVNAVWSTALMGAYATNRHGRIAVAYILVYGAGTLGLTYVAMQIVGLSGSGLALLFAEVAMAGYVLPTALRLSDDSWGSWLRTVLRPPWFLMWCLREGRASSEL